MMSLLLSHILSNKSTRILCWKDGFGDDGMVLCFTSFCIPQSAYGQPSGEPQPVAQGNVEHVACKLSIFGLLANNLPVIGNVSW